ncbi:hypothetical protein NHX12_004142 [Muraenolepis orangiensis]|uniref:Uncharacterized protein n=1 Tax=Muraenolepis orangiensis TaxID=630683 RepID=A0A9Q0IBW6_9TELE|nr:hypothetical protein NHX12_004142 [Muraenolepis orangiensis]
MPPLHSLSPSPHPLYLSPLPVSSSSPFSPLPALHPSLSLLLLLLLQGVSLRPTRHFVTTTGSAARKKCNGDLAVIVASMAYNTWFTKLHCKDMRLGSEVVDQVLHTVSKSNSLEELTLENAGLKSDFPQKMASALSENPSSVVHSLNLSHNTLDNQGVSNLIQQVCRLNKGLRLLNLSKTSLSSKGVVSLSQALCSSDDYSNSLIHLDLSRNPGVLSGDDATNLYLFLAQPNCLVHLDLSGTDCTVDLEFGWRRAAVPEPSVRQTAVMVGVVAPDGEGGVSVVFGNIRLISGFGSEPQELPVRPLLFFAKIPTALLYVLEGRPRSTLLIQM